MSDDALLGHGAENVRLVIWDLDDTLWAGTLSEGGISDLPENNFALVRELARRGIISSICSKNDHHAVERILTRAGIWDYFVFPSIDWSAKGPRLKALIEAVKLRPQSILFIDDHPANRAEALKHVPGIQVADELVIPTLLDDPRLQGQCDPEMERLGRYRILQSRQSQAKAEAHNGDAATFLHESGVRVRFEYDVEANLDRAIELINRTNQLNFTKKRLPEDLNAARVELTTLIGAYNISTGLIHVMDNFGDYGYCGFYVVESTTLIHYCFSCRVLGMGIESWLYDQLGEPGITIASPVVSSLTGGDRVDWIAIDKGLSAGEGSTRAAQIAIPELRLRGGCHLFILWHYFSNFADEVHCEANTISKHLFMRNDCSENLHFDQNFVAELEADLADFALPVSAFRSNLFDPISDNGVIILSFWGDVDVAHLRHNKKGYIVPNNLIDSYNYNDIPTEEQLRTIFDSEEYDDDVCRQIYRAVECQREKFSYQKGLNAIHAAEKLDQIIRHLPQNAQIFVLLPAEKVMAGADEILHEPSRDYNVAITGIVEKYDHVTAISTEACVLDSSQRHLFLYHFDRTVYFRMFKAILEAYVAIMAKPASLNAPAAPPPPASTAEGEASISAGSLRG